MSFWADSESCDVTGSGPSPSRYGLTGEPVVVMTGEVAAACAPTVLVTPALGSCVGVALWDPRSGRGGLAHVMLPAPADSRPGGRVDRFASIAVPHLAGAVAEGMRGCRPVAKIAGGSAMFGADGSLARIGERNVAEVKRQLALLRIPVVAEDTGGTHARTMELHTETGLIVVRSHRYGTREL